METFTYTVMKPTGAPDVINFVTLNNVRWGANGAAFGSQQRTESTADTTVGNSIFGVNTPFGKLDYSSPQEQTGSITVNQQLFSVHLASSAPVNNSVTITINVAPA